MRLTTNERQRRAAAVGFLAVAFALVALATLQPTESNVETPLLCVFCGSLGGVDFVLNVVLFIPLGMAARWTLGRWSSVLITGLVTTVLIETLQWRLIPGRDSSLGDLLANTAGTLIGAWLAVAVFRWWHATGPAARAGARVSGIAAGFVVIGSSVLLQPLVPRYAQGVQWTPSRPMMDQFSGALLGVEIKGRAVHRAEIARADERFDPGTRSVMVRARVGTPPPAPTRRPAIIVRIANSIEEGFSLMQRGDAATFRARMVGERLKLRSLLVGLDGAFAGASLDTPGSSFVLEAESTPRQIALRRLSAVDLSASIPRTVGLAWTMVLPWDVAVSRAWLLANAAWLAALVFPASFFLARSARTAGQFSGPLARWPLFFILAVLTASPLTGLSPLAIVEWVGVVGGITAGWLLARWRERPARTGGRHAFDST